MLGVIFETACVITEGGREGAADVASGVSLGVGFGAWQRPQAHTHNGFSLHALSGDQALAVINKHTFLGSEYGVVDCVPSRDNKSKG